MDCFIPLVDLSKRERPFNNYYVDLLYNVGTAIYSYYRHSTIFDRSNQ